MVKTNQKSINSFQRRREIETLKIFLMIFSFFIQFFFLLRKNITIKFFLN